ncbi:MAG: zinc ribbon domain-containing protein [Deltaproteobacteria bacterium]|nr:zinc ribbon domain-containing protein [Deltaproteobacteria bacterium]
MPIYEYRCDACGEVFEQLVFASDKDEPVECPSCGRRKTKRQLSSFSCGSSSEGLGAALTSGCGSSGGGFS